MCESEGYKLTDGLKNTKWTYGQDHQDGYPYLNLVKRINQGIVDGKGRGIAWDIKKYIFIFITKLRQFTEPGPFSPFQLVKLSQLCYHLL